VDASAHDGQSSIFQNLRDLELNVRAHVVMASVLWIRRVQVEAGTYGDSYLGEARMPRGELRHTCAEIPVVILTFNPSATG
jgi:hypothetical protein